MEPVTLYNPTDGRAVTTRTRAEVVRLRAAGYDDTQPFDPEEHTVEEVLEHLTEHPEDTLRVETVERAGKGRRTILGSEPEPNSDGESGNTEPATD